MAEIKTYIINDNWTDLGAENKVAVMSVDGEIDKVYINGEEAGGGGGDFSTATLTIIVDANTSGDGVAVTTGFYLGEEDVSTYVEEYFYIAENDTEVEADFILNASNEVELLFGEGSNVTIVSSSGDINVGKKIYLSGDATIHITISA